MHGFKNDPTYPADCQIGNSALTTRGDSWLRDHVEQWRAQGAIVIITFDEGKSELGGGGRIYTVAVGPGVQPEVVTTPVNHYSLLAGIEDRFGLPRLNNAAGATPLPIDGAVVTPPPPNPVVFEDDFSSGLSLWTATTRVTVDASAGSPSPPSARVQVSAASAVAAKALSSTYPSLCLSVNVNETQFGGNILFRFRTAVDGPIARVLLDDAGYLRFRSDVSGVQKRTVQLGTGWHTLKLCGTVGPAGTWDLWRDGVTILDGWVADTGSQGIGRISLGDPAAKTWTANFDQVVVSTL